MRTSSRYQSPATLLGLRVELFPPGVPGSRFGEAYLSLPRLTQKRDAVAFRLADVE
jgi:hypothetical protein